MSPIVDTAYPLKVSRVDLVAFAQMARDNCRVTVLPKLNGNGNVVILDLTPYMSIVLISEKEKKP